MNSIETPAAVQAAVLPVPAEQKSIPESQASSGNQALHLVTNAAGAILILGLGVVGFMFFGRMPEVQTDICRRASASIAPLVEVAIVNAWDQPFHLDIDGEAATYRVLTVGAEVTGRVLRKPETTRSGTFVHEGDLLFEIDPVNYQLEEQRLKAQVAHAREEFKAVDVDIQNATTLLTLAVEENKLRQNHLERVRSSFERKAASESDLDTAKREELVSRNAMQTQQNQLNALQQMKKTKDL